MMQATPADATRSAAPGLWARHPASRPCAEDVEPVVGANRLVSRRSVGTTGPIEEAGRGHVGARDSCGLARKTWMVDWIEDLLFTGLLFVAAVLLAYEVLGWQLTR
jgi:hypothetical protein